MSEVYKFVKFEGTYSRGDTRIAINKSGLIRLSSGFCRATDIKSFHYSVLFYDDTNKAIAFKFTNTQEDGAFKVTSDGSGATISAKSFMIANHLQLRSYARRYDWKKLAIPDIGDVYIIELSKQ